MEKARTGRYIETEAQLLFLRIILMFAGTSQILSSISPVFCSDASTGWLPVLPVWSVLTGSLEGSLDFSNPHVLTSWKRIAEPQLLHSKVIEAHDGVQSGFEG